MNLVNLEGKQAITNYKYWLYPEAISKKQCELILEETNWNLQHMAEFMSENGSVMNKDIRETTVTFVAPHSAIGCILQTHLMNVNAFQWNYDIRSVQDIQIGHYAEGGHYDWHSDTTDPDENNIQRKLSAVLMLSNENDYEGGKLEFKNQEIPLLTQGSIIVFPSFFQHRVTKVTKGNRYTAVAWAVGPSFR